MCSCKWKLIICVSIHASTAKQRWVANLEQQSRGDVFFLSFCCSLLQIQLFAFSVLLKSRLGNGKKHDSSGGRENDQRAQLSAKLGSGRYGDPVSALPS